MNDRMMKAGILSGAMTALLLTAAPARATEGGGSAYPHGAEGWMTGMLPPEGTYLLNYSTYNSADRLNDGDGEQVPVDFQVEAFANTVRFVHVTDKKILGGTYAFQVLVPLVDVSVDMGERRDHRAGLGDIVVDPFILGWHFDKLHIAAGVDIILPTGRYNKDALANIGRNYVTFEPAVAITYHDPKGPELSAKLMYDMSTRNKATDYQSGNEFHVDFAAGWNFPKSSLGVAGYYNRQTTDDRQGGMVVGDGNRGTAFAIGPTVKVQAGKVPIMLTWQHEVVARNRSQGDKLWIKAIFSLGGGQ